VALQYGPLALSDDRYYLSSNDYLMAAESYGAEGRFRQAVEEIENLRRKVRGTTQAAALDPPLVSIEGNYRIQLANQLFKAGEHERAREQLSLVEQAYSELVGANYPHSHLYDLGLLYQALGEPSKAQMAYELFLAKETEGVRAEQVKELVKRLEAEAKP